MDTKDITNKLQDFQLYLKHMPKDDMYAFLSIFIGIVLLVIAFITFP